MDSNHTNTFMAIALSIMVLIAWQYFYVSPRIEDERQAAEIAAQREASTNTETQSTGEASNIPTQTTQGSDETVPAAPAQGAAPVSREAAISVDPRVSLETDLLIGSINTRGARIDDLRLKNYHVTPDKSSPLIELLSPRGASNAYFAEFGYVKSASSGEVPGPETVWQVEQGESLGVGSPVTLSWTNEKGIQFSRQIAIDDGYMFTVTDTVTNSTGQPAEITPYGRVARFGQPKTANIFVLHEGLIGVLGEEGLQEIDYDDIIDDKEVTTARVNDGWLGITDKYWAAALIPGQSFKPRFSYFDKGVPHFQTDFIGEADLVAAGASTSIENRLFAGAKITRLIDAYDEDLNLNNFDLIIDWGWFYFITKPLFFLLDWLYTLIGNFGFAILTATVLVKAVFFPLANMSYASMAKMKKVQPEMMEIRERYAEDKVKQQQEMMALYKREKINPAAGCWPILIQIPVFFALYKVLYVTIEMRHAPFIGWINDLAAPDPTSIFNLFGLLPFEAGGIFLLGVWPLLMGITMFLQMQMNPAPPDPTQAMIFKWMPIVFTFMLASFPAGLVIYWAWNNTLSIIQQGAIMKRHGVKIELWDNLKSMFQPKKKEEPDE